MKIDQKSLGHLQQWHQVEARPRGLGTTALCSAVLTATRSVAAPARGGERAVPVLLPALARVHTHSTMRHTDLSWSRFGGTQPPAGKVETELEKQPLVTVDVN